MSNLPPIQRNQPPRQDALARLQIFVNAISLPYVVLDSIRFSILTREGVKGLIVPRTRSVSRSMHHVDLLPYPNSSNFSHMGYDCANLPLKTLLCCNMLGRKNIRLLWSRRNAPSRYTTALNCYLMNIPAALLLSQLGRR